MRSRICLVYDLDARVMIGGRPEPLDVLEFTVACISRRIMRDADRRRMAEVLQTRLGAGGKGRGRSPLALALSPRGWSWQGPPGHRRARFRGLRRGVSWGVVE